MSLTEPLAVVLAACIGVPPSIWLGLRTKGAKRDALERLVAAAVETSNKEHREQVAWLQGQILYYQQMSQPTKFTAPTQPPDQT